MVKERRIAVEVLFVKSAARLHELKLDLGAPARDLLRLLRWGGRRLSGVGSLARPHVGRDNAVSQGFGREDLGKVRVVEVHPALHPGARRLEATLAVLDFAGNGFWRESKGEADPVVQQLPPELVRRVNKRFASLVPGFEPFGCGSEEQDALELANVADGAPENWKR